MSATLRVFGKDVRQFAHLLSVLAILHSVFAVLVVRNVGRGDSQIQELMQWALPMCWIVLIGLVVTSDPLSGGASYWLTRPCSRSQIFAAKILFIVSFVNLPWLISDCFILLSVGIPVHLVPLLLRQLPLCVLVVAPVFVLATVSRSPWEFVLLLPASVVTLALGSYAWEIVNPDHLRARDSDLIWLIPWIAGVLLIVGIQYAVDSRMMRVAAAALSIVPIGPILSYAHLTRDNAFYLPRSFGDTQPFRGEQVKIELEAPRQRGERPRYVATYWLRARVSGVPEGMSVAGEGETYGFKKGYVDSALYRYSQGRYFLTFYADGEAHEQPYDLRAKINLVAVIPGKVSRVKHQPGRLSIPGFGVCALTEDTGPSCWNGPSAKVSGRVGNERNDYDEFRHSALTEELNWFLSPIQEWSFYVRPGPDGEIAFQPVAFSKPFQVTVSARQFPLAECEADSGAGFFSIFQ